jgi:hypothetical protein
MTEATCGLLSRYLGQQEGESERDALRAEVEMLRRALEVLAECEHCLPTREWQDAHCADDGGCSDCTVRWGHLRGGEVMNDSYIGQCQVARCDGTACNPMAVGSDGQMVEAFVTVQRRRKRPIPWRWIPWLAPIYCPPEPPAKEVQVKKGDLIFAVIKEVPR